jgi:hypothetical protein
MMEARMGDRLDIPFQRGMKPVTSTVRVDQPAAGQTTVVSLIKVPAGFIFNSTHFGVMMDITRYIIPPNFGSNQTSIMMDTVRDFLIDLRANGKSVVTTDILPPPYTIPAGLPTNFVQRSITVATWPYGSPDPADFMMTAKENEVIEVAIQNIAQVTPIPSPAMLVRIDGWYSESKLGQQRY